DEGEIDRRSGLRTAMLSQGIPDMPSSRTVFSVILGGFGDIGRVVDRFRRLSHGGGDTARPGEIERLHHRIDADDGWQTLHRSEAMASRMGLALEERFAELSAGQKRRVLLARALVTEPDLLLLDEPTNHLDITAINWLEADLSRFAVTMVLVTHDRAFMERLATRILYLDRGRLTGYSCDFATFLKRRDAMLDADERAEDRFDQRLAREEEWIRQGVKARRRRNQGRLKALLAMRRVRETRRVNPGSLRLVAQEAERSGKLVIEVDEVSYRWQQMPVIDRFSTLIMRGDRVGIIGESGAGKSTLIKLLLGNLTPGKGQIRRGSRLEIAYFDQLREQLDPDASVVDSLADGNDTVRINGKPRHVMGYLRDFLFSPDRARSPVRTLSGGERNRLLLARLFTRPSNLLILDEPTNDLDIETIELLEEMLMDYAGTLLVVSHDRAFLNHVVTSILAFEGNGRIRETIGGYDDWLRQQRTAPQGLAAPCPGSALPARQVRHRERKLTFNENRELETLPGKIEALEAEQKALFDAMADPDVYRRGGDRVSTLKKRLDEIEHQLTDAYRRWEILEAIAR
ncbi:MAG: ATP-binding cassette domain-containing protein, partial [Desulfobacterales bacterium]